MRFKVDSDSIQIRWNYGEFIRLILYTNLTDSVQCVWLLFLESILGIEDSQRDRQITGIWYIGIMLYPVMKVDTVKLCIKAALD